MKWHIVGLEVVVNLTLLLGVALVVAACTSQLPALDLECEAGGARERFGLWCNKPPLPLSESMPTPETSAFPSRLVRQNSNAR